MSKDTMYRRGPIVGALLLIAFGALFLYANFRPEWNPWPLVSRYWPLLLIFLGLVKLWDHFRLRGRPEAAGTTGLTGGAIAVLILLLLFGVALSRGVGTRHELHQAESVERRGADSVSVLIKMPAGELRVAGGANKLLEADFYYTGAGEKPSVAYDVTGNQGRLTVAQPDAGIHVGPTHNNWDLRLNNDVPMELKVEVGAGQSDLRLRGLSLTRLDIQMGVGQLTADLTGDRKKDLDAKIQGGVGNAAIRLPRNVGVWVHAAGGIGAINARGLEREGDAYINEVYGRSAVTLRLNIEGGIGHINLVPAI